MKQGELLQSSKLLVIARLLHRDLASQAGGLKFLQAAQDRIAALRRQILSQVDDGLARPNAPSQALIRLGCTYCLVTNSSSSDVLSHFREIRLQHLQSRTQESDWSHNEIAKLLKYHIKSAKAASTFSSHQFSDSLRLLQARPILKDSKLRQMPSLALKSLSPLVVSEILDFVPYIKQNDLSQIQIREEADVWSERMFSVFSNGLERASESCTNMEELFHLREKLFSVWLPTCFSIKSKVDILDGLRKQLNLQIISQLDRQAKALHSIDASIIKSFTTTTMTESLWSAEFVNRRLRKGQDLFTLQIRSRNLGLKGAVWDSIQELQGWCSSVERCQSVIDSSRRTRWKDKIEDAESEDEGKAASTMDVLGQVDPQAFRLAFETQLKRSKEYFEKHLADAMRDLEDTEKIPVLIRVVRECDQRIAPIFEGHGLKLAIDRIPTLHQRMASACAESLLHDVRNDHSGKIGSADSTLPPDVPSPRAFRTLMQLCNLMIKLGGHDVWTRPAVDRMKTTAWEAISTSERTEVFMQTDFDRHYLEVALRPSQQASAGKREPGNSAEAPVARAEEYWKRNKMLFGVLA